MQKIHNKWYERIPLFVCNYLIKNLKAFSYFLVLILFNHNYLYSKPHESLLDYAKSITLGIETPGSSGSGFLIGKKNNTYFFLTAAHVAFSNPLKEEYWAYSLASDSLKKFRIKSFIRPKEFKDKDIVIGSFTAKENLPLALIFPLDTKKYFASSYKIVNQEIKNIFKFLIGDDSRYWGIYEENVIKRFSDNYSKGERSFYEYKIQSRPFIAGVSIPSKSIEMSIFRYTPLIIQSRAGGNQEGYEVIYSAISTVPGMSGGAIIAARDCPFMRINGYPGVIAMHGMSEEYKNSGSRSGTGLGIPLDLVTDYFAANHEEYGILFGETYINELIKRCYSSRIFY